MDYILSNKIRYGIDHSGNKWTEIRSNGDFRRTIDFVLNNRANGIIFQYIKKNTNAVGIENGSEILLNTTNAISKYTGGRVKFMCDSYLEYFVVEDGQTFGDQFGNGAIAKYDEEDEAILDDTDPISRGTIKQIGTSVFIENGPFIDKIKQLPWSDAETTPANGLPYLKYNEPLWNSILTNSNSNILTQHVTISWGYGVESQGVCVECDPVIKKSAVSSRSKRGGSKKKSRTYKRKVRSL